jgi:hypothetical protein
VGEHQSSAFTGLLLVSEEKAKLETRRSELADSSIPDIFMTILMISMEFTRPKHLFSGKENNQPTKILF